MKVGKSVQKTIDEWQAGDLDSAMLHACNAVDGTAGKQDYPEKGNRARFARLVRENYDVFGPMGAPGINLVLSKFPVQTSTPDKFDLLDIADIIYRVHRCTHGHGDELPQGFELVRDAAGPARFTRMHWEIGKIRLSDRVLFGLLAIAVLSPKNVDEKTAEGQYLTYAGSPPLYINDWWGRKHDFLPILASDPVPLVTFDFSVWMAARTPSV